jgi:lipid-A-disaccharide synthase
VARIVIIAGETSGDRLAAGLIEAARAIQPDVEFEGVAGPEMVSAGCIPWHDSSELAVMGIFEVLRDLPRLRRLMADLEARVLRDPPDVFVGVDAPDFNLRLETRLRAAGIRTVHYVSPSVWAWRPGRVKVLRAACDLVLCLLPFEAAFLERHGIAARFIGHPLADEIPDQVEPTAVREALGLGPGPVVAILPGSRMGEVKRLGRPFVQAAEWLTNRAEGIQFVVPTVSHGTRELFERCWTEHGPLAQPLILDGRAHEAMAAADVVLTASGTATLEAMLVGRPMVVAYRVSASTFMLFRCLRLAKVAYFSLPNLLADQPLVPEYLQSQVTGPALGAAVLGFIEAPDRCATTLATFGELRRQLRRSASRQAATAVLQIAGTGTTGATDPATALQ